VSDDQADHSDIVHVFRASHLSEQLASAPFSPEQVASFRRGVVPDGEAPRLSATGGGGGVV
jgi:hypothetical protein